jgi:hypothetical protein
MISTKRNDVDGLCNWTRYSTTTSPSLIGTGRIKPGHGQRPSPQQRTHQSLAPNPVRSMRDLSQIPAIWNLIVRLPPTNMTTRRMRHSYGTHAPPSRTKRGMADPTCRNFPQLTPMTNAANRTANMAATSTNPGDDSGDQEWGTPS